MFENIFQNKTILVVAASVIAVYISFLIFKLLVPVKSDIDSDIEQILTSDKYKVKGRFE